MHESLATPPLTAKSSLFTATGVDTARRRREVIRGAGMTIIAGSRRRRREVGISLRSWTSTLLLLVAVWELPLNAVGAAGAEDIDAVAAAAPDIPAPSTPVPSGHDAYPELIDPASSASVDVRKNRILVGDGDGSLAGGPPRAATNIDGGSWRLVDALSDVVEAIVGSIARLVGGVFGGFCRVWQALIKFVKDQVDLVMQFVFGIVDPGHNWKSTKAITGFVDMTLDMATYPLRWLVSFGSASPFGHCFHTTYYPCIKKRPRTLPSYVRCGLRLSSRCGFFDMFFRYRPALLFGDPTDVHPASFDDAAPAAP